MNFSEFTGTILNRSAQWCRGRNWLVRLPFLIWFGYCLVKYWVDPDYNTILSPLNLGIHEFGHMVFAFFGQFIGVLGGTFFQLLAPVLSAVNFYRQTDFFSVVLSFCWLSLNFFEVARYAGDARQMSLPLVSPFGAGEDIVHDWNYILTGLNILQYDTVLAVLFKCSGTILMLVSLAAGFWLLWQMKESNVSNGGRQEN